MTSFIKNVRNLIFPKLCVFCGKEPVAEETFVCSDCAFELTKAQGKLCRICAHAVHACNCNTPKHLDASKTVFWYNGIVRRLVGTMKDRRYEELFDYAAKRMCDLIKESEYFISCDVVTFVPRSKKKLSFFGVDPAYQLAKRISENLSIPLQNYLVCSDKKIDQKELDFKRRRKNAANCFSVSPGTYPFGRILLVDDVTTTGATAEECSKVLKKAGAVEVLGIFLAKTHAEKLMAKTS